MNDHYTKKLEDWKKAGEIAATALAFGKELVVEGAKAVDICNAVDAKIIELGAKPAFPAQIAIGSTAAHFCPEEDDKTTLGKTVISLDCGAEVNGAIGDNAVSVDLTGENDDLIQASRDALHAAISVIKPGVTTGDIGKAIETAIKARGYTPVVNLSGHGLDYYTIHTKPTIPNYANGSDVVIEEGMIFAIEPFASTGSGRVIEAGESTIFSQIDTKPVRTPGDRLVQNALKQFGGMPFTTRNLTKDIPAFKVKMALKNLQRLHCLHPHPPLIDSDKGLVSQAEHTVLVTADGCEILTMPQD